MGPRRGVGNGQHLMQSGEPKEREEAKKVSGNLFENSRARSDGCANDIKHAYNSDDFLVGLKGKNARW